MNRATRDKFTSGTNQVDVTGGNACWQTPPAVFEKLHDEFAFDIDLFADAGRALAPVWFGPGSEFAEDALATVWGEWGTTGFANPPYGAFIGDVLVKAEFAAMNGFTSVHLIPLRMTKALRWAVFTSKRVSDWLFPDRRITFFENGAPRLYRNKQGLLVPASALFDSTILVFRPGVHLHPKVREWRVPDHVPQQYRRGRKTA